MNYNEKLNDKSTNLELPPPVIHRKSPYFEYMASDSENRNQSLIRSPYFLLNRQNGQAIAPSKTGIATRKASVVPTQQVMPPLTLEAAEPLVYSNFDDQSDVSLIDDHDPVPEFIHHPRWDIWFRPRQTLRFLINQVPLTGKFIFLISGLALTSRLISLYQTHRLDLVSQLNFSWVLTLTACLGIGCAFGSIIWRWESLISTYLGKALGGYGSRETVGQAVLWAYIPVTASIMLHGAGLMMLGGSYFANQVTTPLWIEALTAALNIYSLVFGIVLLSEAHKISLFRSVILKVLASLLVYGIPLITTVLLYRLLIAD